MLIQYLGIIPIRMDIACRIGIENKMIYNVIPHERGGNQDWDIMMIFFLIFIYKIWFKFND